MQLEIVVFLLCIVIGLSVLHAVKVQEHYFSPEYSDMLSVPASAYSSLSDDDTTYEKRYFLEFNDRFFHQTLLSALSSQKTDYSDWQESKGYDKENVRYRVSQHIEDILNRALPSWESDLFTVVKNDVQRVYKSDDNGLYVVKSKLLMHRNQKLYGVSLETTTLHDRVNYTSVLLEYKINGFVFEDKLDDVMPANYETDSQLAYENVSNDKIIKDAEYEKRVQCKYFSDLRKFRGLDIDDSQCE